MLYSQAGEIRVEKTAGVILAFARLKFHAKVRKPKAASAGKRGMEDGKSS